MEIVEEMIAAGIERPDLHGDFAARRHDLLDAQRLALEFRGREIEIFHDDGEGLVGRRVRFGGREFMVLDGDVDRRLLRQGRRCKQRSQSKNCGRIRAVFMLFSRKKEGSRSEFETQFEIGALAREIRQIEIARLILGMSRGLNGPGGGKVDLRIELNMQGRADVKRRSIERIEAEPAIGAVIFRFAAHRHFRREAIGHGGGGAVARGAAPARIAGARSIRARRSGSPPHKACWRSPRYRRRGASPC